MHDQLNHRGVMIVVAGTRGDVQPFIALAHALQRRGIRAKVAASVRWRPLLIREQIPWYEIPEDPTTLLLKPQYKAALTLQHGIIRGVIDTLRYLWDSRMQMRALNEAAIHLRSNDEIIIASLATQWAMPTDYGIWGLLQPIIPTMSFASPLWPFPQLRVINKFTHLFMNWVLWLPWKWQGGARRAGLASLQKHPVLVAISPILLPVWYDRLPQHVVTGVWREEDTRMLPDTVNAFIARGKPFVVITMGTPGKNESARWYQQLCRAVRACGLSVVLHAPKEVIGSIDTHEELCVIHGDVNHQALFRGATVIVHHGGAGTFHTACYVGVPSLIIARGVDQQFWGERAVALGVAPKWIARSRAKMSTISKTLDEFVHNPVYRYRSRDLAQQLTKEQGAQHAAQIIAQYIQE